jgi:pimeloyl-ACP methyl ester carboxylesterase
LKTIAINTQQGIFHAHVLGDTGSWVACWPAQLTDHQCLLNFAQQLAIKHRVVMFDPPAVGANQNLPYSDNIKSMVYFAQSALSRLGIEQCHWVGLSAGGVVGAALRIAAPNLILSLTLAGTPMLSQGRFKLTAAASKNLLAGSSWGRRVLVSRSTAQVGHRNDEEKKLVSRYLRHLLERTPPPTIRAMRPLDSAVVRNIFDKLRTCLPPILVLCGKYDPVVLPRDQRTVAEITHAQFVELPCGHMNLLVEPEKSAHAFERFVQARHEYQHKPEAMAA